MRKPTPPGLNVKKTDQTKVSEWKRGWCLASDRRRIPPCRCPARPALPPRWHQERVRGRGRTPMPNMMSGTVAKLELEPYRPMTGRRGRLPSDMSGPSVPEPIGNLAGDHGARTHHHGFTAGVDMTVEPGMTAVRGPIGIAAIFAGFETEGAHVVRPMRLRLHHYGDAVAGFLPGQRAFGWRTGAVLMEYSVDIDRCRHQGSPKEKPGHEDRASCGNGKRDH